MPRWLLRLLSPKPPAPPKEWPARIYVTDADGLTAYHQLHPKQPKRNPKYRIRLAAIDAPESDQPGGPEGTAALKAIADNRFAYIHTVKRDRYGRYIAFVKIRNDGITDSNAKWLDLSQWLVAEGHAWAYFQHDKRYSGLHYQAKANRKGLWAAEKEPTAPWTWRAKHGTAHSRRKPWWVFWAAAIAVLTIGAESLANERGKHCRYLVKEDTILLTQQHMLQCNATIPEKRVQPYKPPSMQWRCERSANDTEAASRTALLILHEANVVDIGKNAVNNVLPFIVFGKRTVTLRYRIGDGEDQRNGAETWTQLRKQRFTNWGSSTPEATLAALNDGTPIALQAGRHKAGTIEPDGDDRSAIATFREQCHDTVAE